MHSNRILDAIEPSVRSDLLAIARPLEFRRGDIIALANDPIEAVLFPASGAIGLTVELKKNDRIVVALVGQDDAIAGELAFGQHRHSSDVVAQADGSGWVVPAAKMVEATKVSRHLALLLFSSHQFILAKAQQTAACHAQHSLSQRLASWLLRLSAAANSDRLFMTQTEMVSLVGATRAAISSVASRLSDAQAVEYRRGRLRIVDRHVLASYACECHRRIAEMKTSLFGSSAPEHSVSIKDAAT